MPARRISSEELLADVLRVADQLGAHTLLQREYRANGGKHDVNTFAERFGSWAKMLRRVKLVPGRIGEPTTKLIADDISRVAQSIGRSSLVFREYRKCGGRHSVQDIMVRFGSWPMALRAAKLTPQTSSRVPNAELLEDLQRVRSEASATTVTSGLYRAHGRYSVETMTRRFKSWSNAVRAAGMTPMEGTPRIPDEMLTADLRRVWELQGRSILKMMEYREYGKYGCDTIVKRWGSWASALRTAGLPVDNRQLRGRIPNTAILRNIRYSARALGRPTITGDEYAANGGRYSVGLVIKRFGSWPNALFAAGLQPTAEQVVRSYLRTSLRILAAIPGLTTEDQVKVAKTVDGVRDLGDEVILQLFRRMNLGPVELPSGIPSGVPFWERCIAALQKVQPDPEKLKATGVLERLGRQLHRAVALELLGREPLSPAEEQRVAAELRLRKPLDGG